MQGLFSHWFYFFSLSLLFSPPLFFSLLERFHRDLQHPASDSPRDTLVKLCGCCDIPASQTPPWCLLGHRPPAPPSPADLGSPVHLLGTRPGTGTCTLCPRRAGSALGPGTCGCHRGTGSPWDSRHHLQAQRGLGGIKEAQGVTTPTYTPCRDHCCAAALLFHAVNHSCTTSTKSAAQTAWKTSPFWLIWAKQHGSIPAGGWSLDWCGPDIF